jgi:hypothetical protein
VDFRFSAENATKQKSIFRKSGLPVFRRKCDQAKEAFSGKVDFRFSAENATKQKSIFRKSGLSVFRRKMRPRKTNSMQSPGQPPGALFIATRRAARIAASLPRTHALEACPFAAASKRGDQLSQ